MRMCSIASGSSGNCIYIGDEDTHILIDAGISRKAIETGLKELELSGNDLDGIFKAGSRRHDRSDPFPANALLWALWKSLRRFHPDCTVR